MKTFASRIALLAAALLLLSSGARAQAFRAYLASYGSDTNAGCPVTAPCRLLPAAINAVASGGEVWILDSANFNQGTVNITKSVSILAVPGQIASIVAVAGGPAITVTADVTVGLHNLVITGNVINPGTHGLSVTAGSSGHFVSVEDCLFVNLPGNGIVASNQPAHIFVKNTVFRHNGIYAVVATNGPVIEIADSRMFGNSSGNVQAFAGIAGTATVVNVTDSTLSGGGEGVVAAVSANATATIMVVRSTIQDTGNALHAATSGGVGQAMVVVTNSTVTNSSTGILQTGTGSIVKSLGNNYIADNGGDTGTLTQTPLR